MNLKQFLEVRGNRTAKELIENNEFNIITQNPSILAAAHASRLVFKKPYKQEFRDLFISKHKEAWAHLVTNLSNWEQSSESFELPRDSHILIAAWHFPEVPLLFSFAKKNHVLVLVSQYAEWMEELKKEGCSLNMAEQNSSIQLSEEMEKGRIIGCIFDHYHPEWQSVETTFLGRRIRTHTGVFELCIKHNYLIAFIAPRPNGIQIVKQIDSQGHSSQEIAQYYCNWLETEVKEAPESWLMWQGLPFATIEIHPDIIKMYTQKGGK